MGPFELADYVGLDTTKFIIDGKIFQVKRYNQRSVIILIKILPEYRIL